MVLSHPLDSEDQNRNITKVGGKMRAARERSVDGPARVGDYKIIKKKKGRKEKEEKKKSRPVTESKMRDVCVVVEAKRGLSRVWFGGDWLSS